MARPSKFTDEALLAAATALKEAGKDVTGYALSAALDGGRPSSLQERYNELVAIQAAAVPLPALPSGIEAAITDLVADVNKRLTAVLTHAHVGIQKAADERITQIEAEEAAEVEKFKAELDEAVELLGAEKDRAIAAEDELKAALEAVDQLRTELAQKSGELDAMKRSHDELTTKLMSKLDQLNTATNAVKA